MRRKDVPAGFRLRIIIVLHHATTKATVGLRFSSFDYADRRDTIGLNKIAKRMLRRTEKRIIKVAQEEQVDDRQDASDELEALLVKGGQYYNLTGEWQTTDLQEQRRLDKLVLQLEDI